LDSAQTPVNLKRKRIVTIQKPGKDPAQAYCSNECFFWDLSYRLRSQIYYPRSSLALGGVKYDGVFDGADHTDTRLLSELLRELPGPIAIYTDDGSKTENLVRFGVFLFRFPEHCGIFTAEIYDINLACDFIKSKPMGADSFASIERLKSTGMSLNDVGIQGNEPADVLAKERSISGTLFQDQAELTTVNISNIHIRTRTRLLIGWNDKDMGRYCLSILLKVSTET
jgi:hypothetical protein